MSSRLVPLCIFVLVLALMSLFGAHGARAELRPSTHAHTHERQQQRRHRAASMKDLYANNKALQRHNRQQHLKHGNGKAGKQGQGKAKQATKATAHAQAQGSHMGYGWQNKVTHCGKGADPKCSWGREITASITPREHRVDFASRYSVGRTNHRDSYRSYSRHPVADVENAVESVVKGVLEGPMAGLADLQMRHGAD